MEDDKLMFKLVRQYSEDETVKLLHKKIKEQETIIENKDDTIRFLREILHNQKERFNFYKNKYIQIDKNYKDYKSTHSVGKYKRKIKELKNKYSELRNKFVRMKMKQNND